MYRHLLRQSIRRLRHARAIRRGTFGDHHDPLFRRLREWVPEGTLAIDVGAAVGTYTLELSRLVGPTGRVIAIEPVREQFEILAHNIARAPYANITALQYAAGDVSGIVRISAPIEHGRANYYEARVCDDGDPVLCIRLDELVLPIPPTIIKIDAEGFDLAVLRGAERLVREHRPVLYLEDARPPLLDWLVARGYPIERTVLEHGSVNHAHLTEQHEFRPGSWLAADAMARMQLQIES